MRALFLSTLIFVAFSFISLAQNWFPLEVGNEWQYFGHGQSGGINYYWIGNKSVYDSIIIDGKKYFLMNYAYYLTNYPVRFDIDSNKIFFNLQNQEFVYMDFNIPVGQNSFNICHQVQGLQAGQ